jgi:hypothetical protein
MREVLDASGYKTTPEVLTTDYAKVKAAIEAWEPEPGVKG